MTKITKVEPLVSVNIRTYNSAKTLGETLLSVKRQTYLQKEIVVSDGHSRDESVTLAKKFKARVNYADKLGDARIKNIKASRGKYILSLDSDQIMDATLIAKCVALSEKKNFDALIIAEKSLRIRNNYLENLIAYDKWLIDSARLGSPVFDAACPRFFKKSLLAGIKWPQEMAIFDDAIIYSDLVRRGYKVGYLGSAAIWHHEVSDWGTLIKKFFRYGKGYFRAFEADPGTISVHSLPRQVYFTRKALTKPQYFLGLFWLYLLKATAAAMGALVSLTENGKQQ
jgi:glycosyltransferase involved in cell wall biosynthesis